MQAAKRKQPTLTATFARNTPYEDANPKVARLNSLLVDLVCKEGLSFRLIESEAFKAFVHELDPRYRLPTRQALSATLVPEKYDKVKSEIKAGLSQSVSQSVTTDMWTASNNVAYMGVTAHWLDGNFGVHNKCLAVKPAPGSHTADLISTELTEVLKDWAIAQKDLHVITDSGANVKKAVSLMPGVLWRPCFAHTLQLCVNGALASREVTDLPKILSKSRSIVGHFRRSPLATSQLAKAQEQLILPRHKLLQDCATRWNSQVSTNVFIEVIIKFFAYNFARPFFAYLRSTFIQFNQSKVQNAYACADHRRTQA